jgi:hypothetical protein
MFSDELTIKAKQEALLDIQINLFWLSTNFTLNFAALKYFAFRQYYQNNIRDSSPGA